MGARVLPGADAFPDQWRALQASGVDFVLQLGDFVSEGTVEEYRAHVAVVENGATRPLLHTIGNHDRSRPNGDADKGLYDAVFGERDWFFDRAGWRFVSLDTSDRGRGLTPAQLTWLAAVLAVPGPKVIFTHVPPAYIKSIEPLKEVGALEEPREDKGGYFRDFFTNYFEGGASEFERLVEANGVKAVYMGHIHAFWAADWKGVRYVISGGGGSPLYPLPPGYPKKNSRTPCASRSPQTASARPSCPGRARRSSFPRPALTLRLVASVIQKVIPKSSTLNFWG
ncbi:MAG: metallophosphoesterase [Elusimicrobiota bacterium]|nr:MAG: metallophosphoesterase [Elusimicrobiota bacterium]